LLVELNVFTVIVGGVAVVAMIYCIEEQLENALFPKLRAFAGNVAFFNDAQL
jgi:hypothetical protein